MRYLVCSSDAIDTNTRAALRQLWDVAYGDRFSDDDTDHAYGGVHVMAMDDDRVIAHASAIPRRIQFGDGAWQTIAYVEAVAVHPDFQHQGIGAELMRRLQDEMAKRWIVAMLSTGRATSFYEALGWQRWVGTSYTQTADGPVEDGEHGGLMVLRFGGALEPDARLTVTCEDRAGDAW